MKLKRAILSGGRWVMEKEIGGGMEGEEREGRVITNKDFLKTYVCLLL